MTASTEQERAEFETAYLSEKIRLTGLNEERARKWFLGRSGEDYTAGEADAAWWAWRWQAARRAPVVAVPQEALALLRWAEFLLATSAPMTSQQKEAWPSLQKASDEMRAYQASMLAAAPQPPEAEIQPKVCKTEIQTKGCIEPACNPSMQPLQADHIPDAGEMVAAPVQLPEDQEWM